MLWIAEFVITVHFPFIVFSPADLAEARHILLSFLQTSTNYSCDKILKSLPLTDLFEERAVVLGKQNFHDKCIAIYIQILGDPDAAAAYCEAVYAADPTNDAIYVSLVEMLLFVPSVPPYSGVPLHPRCLQPDVDFVLSLLERHATRFNVEAVIRILPGTVPLHRLRIFLTRALQHQVVRHHETQVLRGMQKTENIRQQAELAALRATSVSLSELSVCLECGKRFSNQSAFVRKPDGRLVHYSCQQVK